MNACIRIAILALVLLNIAAAQDGKDPKMTEKKAALDRLRKTYAAHGFRSFALRRMLAPEKLAAQLGDDGTFSTLRKDEAAIRAKKMIGAKWTAPQNRVEKLTASAFRKLWRLAVHLRDHPDDALKAKVLKGVLHYGEIETSRPNVGARFHGSCFAIPQATNNIYFALLPDMEKVEAGKSDDPLLVRAHKMIRTLAMQSWTQPYRHDATDANVVQVERFRKHVWWVGGNALAYRPVFPTAILMNSVPMMDVMATVAKNALTPVSQTTYDEAFWTEGFTADGAGWGHGMQSLVWGYPIHGAGAALDILKELRGSPWAQQLDRTNVDAILTFLRGSSWYYHNGHIPPCLGRTNMNYEGFATRTIPSLRIAEALREDWADSLTDDERGEVGQLIAEMGKNRIRMKGQAPGRYTGTRYFYNNDDLIAKSPSAYVLVNMASKRCDGLESAPSMAAGYNFFTDDGLTFFQQRGDEYRRAIGAWNMTAVPGVTARQGEDRLKPVTNWRGYCSRHNFAAGATNGGPNACAGFIFEKMNASWKKDVNDTSGRKPKNPSLYGVKVYKGYFLFGDALLCLGAGLTNKQPEQPGDIWTTIDQTHWRGSVQFPHRDGASPWPADGATHETVLKKRGATGSVRWVAQEGGFAYGVLPDQTPGTVRVAAARRATKWDKISGGNGKKKNKPTEADILQVWIDHGREVENDTYGYLVWLGKGDPVAEPTLRVLSNTKRLQAVANAEGTVTQAVVYHSGSVVDTGAWRIKVSSPCALLVETTNDSCRITVCDARMAPSVDTIAVRTTLPLTGKGVSRDGEWAVVNVSLPTEPHRGRPASAAFRLRTP